MSTNLIRKPLGMQMDHATPDQPTARVQQAAQLIQQLTPQEIGQLVEMVPSLQRPASKKRLRYGIVSDEMRQHVLREVAALGEGYRPMQADDPFVGDMSVAEFFSLSDEEQEQLWAELHLLDIDDFEEHDVQREAQLPVR